MISSAKPFIYLNLEAEKKRCKKLFGDESVERISLFLRERAQHTLKSGDYWMSGGRPDTEEIRRLEKEQAHFDDYLSALDYYYKLGDDMNAALDFGRGFVKQLDTLEKRNESNLVVLAMKCLKRAPFERWKLPFQNTLSPNVEYLAIPKKTDSKNYFVGKRMTFVRFLDFLIADFFEGLRAGHYPQLCENCKRYYLKTDSRRQKYCTQIDPNDKMKRTCQAVAAAKGREAKEKHPLRDLYENRLKTIRTHFQRKKIDDKQAEAAKKVAQECYYRMLSDTEYANTLYKIEIGQDSVYKAAGIKL